MMQRTPPRNADCVQEAVRSYGIRSAAGSQYCTRADRAKPHRSLTPASTASGHDGTFLIAMIAALVTGPSAAVAADDACQPPALPPDALHAGTFNAKGDGQADDSRALQAAIDATPAGGTLLIPAGTYRVRVGQSPLLGLRLKSHMTLLLAPGATLHALPTADGNHALLRLHGVNDVRLYGGQLQGERETHLGLDGEWGMGVEVLGSQRVQIGNVIARGFWGDGFYFGGSVNRWIEVCGVVADGNRRNGMSIVSASDMVVTRSAFLNTRGTAPQAGLDIEPNEGGLTERITVRDSVLRFNHGDGLMITTACESCATNRDNRIHGNYIADNGGEGLVVRYDGHVISSNRVERSGSYGIRLWKAGNAIVEDNWVSGSGNAGLQLEGATFGVFRRNVLHANRGAWRLRWTNADNLFEQNRCADNGVLPPPDQGSRRNRFVDNDGCPDR